MTPNSTLQVVILAAGQGTRMRSASPKVLHQLCGITLLERTTRACLSLKPQRIIVVVGYGREVVETEISRIRQKYSVSSEQLVTTEQHEQNGTGHAVICALPQIPSTANPVVIVPGDIPLIDSTMLTSFLSAHETKAPTLSILTCDHPTGAAFGRILRDAQGSVIGIKEERDCSPEERQIREINSSIYAVDYSFLRDALSTLRPENSQGELYLTDIVARATTTKGGVLAWKHENYESLAGANTRAELADLERVQRQRINTGHMLAGVTLDDPQTTYIDEDVVIAADVRIGPGTKLVGNTTIETDVVIEGHVLIQNCHIESNTLVRTLSVLDDAHIGSGCVIGPFARVRPGTRLEQDVHIGNFVELKNSHLASGVKANHLSYLGDAEIGEKTNIGAGTITCNYDGQKKSRTEIGANSFIGSNSSLVAPLTIAANAYVAAGSTISKSIPEGALGIARADQKNVEHWAEHRKSRSKKEK